MSTESNGFTVEMAELSQVTESDWHRVLSDERRRGVIEVLETSSTPLELEVLAAQVAVREVDSAGVETGVVERVMVALHHKHLPLMDEAGVITYDSDAKFIEAHEEFDALTA